MGKSRSALIYIVDDLIRRGNLVQGRAALLQINPPKVKREQAVDLASLARRAGLPFLALRILNPIVRPLRRPREPATDREKAEYADALTKAGAPAEAIEILKTIDAQRTPEAGLFRASALMAQWDYTPTLPLLSAFAEATREPYLKVVARANLAAALVHERHHAQASVLIDQLLEETREEGHQRLFGNVLELRAANSVLQGEWALAEDNLHLAEEALRQASGLDSFFLRKWRAILALRRSGGDPASLRALGKVKEEALEREHWETVRDCDRYRAISKRDRKLLVHLCFGTPFEGFRRRLLLDFHEDAARLPAEYVWQVGEGESTSASLDLATGKIDGQRQVLKGGGLSHRLLTVLASDFYRPFRVASLHARLFPQEYFNPGSSPGRVHQAIKRLRDAFSAARLPLAVEEHEGLYRISSSSLIALTIRRETEAADKQAWYLQRLREAWPASPFTVQQASRALEVTPRLVQRVLKRALEEKKVERQGHSAQTRYAFPS